MSRDLRALLLEAIPLCAHDPRVWSVSGDDGLWLKVAHRRATVPVQGWKLHVSASASRAAETLQRVLPVLLGRPTTFKLSASEAALQALLDGAGAPSQVGKFITVYPADDAVAVELARALDLATAGLRGPKIPTDRPLRPDGVVWYRYGGFGALMMQSRTGEVAPALRSPDGEAVPDVRGSAYDPPDWVVDPFEAAGLSAAKPAPKALIGGRYLLAGALLRSARGAVSLAVDLDQPGLRVVKQASRALGGLADPAERLRREAAVLAALDEDPRFPAVVDLIEDDDDLFLVLTDLGGETLEAHVIALARQGRTVPRERQTRWGRELASMLGALHGQGWVYRDLKSTNVLVAEDGGLRLVDFESARRLGAPATEPFMGTRGYVSPGQAAGAPAEVGDDIHGLGAILAYLATGAEPSQAPDAANLMDRPLGLLNPAMDPALADVIGRCLSPDPARRHPDMAAVDAALAAADRVGTTTASAPYGRPPLGADDAPSAERARWRDLARALGDTLCAEALRGLDGAACWGTLHPLGAGARLRDINAGAAGIALALAELVGEFGDAEHRRVLEAATHWLRRPSPLLGHRLAGLYVGEAGVAAALLRAGQTLDDGALVEAATETADRLAELDHDSPDLFNGSAGRLRLHLLMWDETGDARQLAHAGRAAAHILATREALPGGGCRWIIPDGFGALAGQTYLGYAHGAAGIGDALLDLFDVTGDPDLLAGAAQAGRWILDCALPALDDGSGWNWPDRPGAAPAAAYWCHGAAGIGRFWLHAVEVGLAPESADAARRALAATARAARWAGPTPCHGLCGGIEVLLDAFQGDGEEAHWREARSLGMLLERFAQQRDGRRVFPSDSAALVTPDFNIGYAGVAATALRLAAPYDRPHLISRRGFRHGARRPGGPAPRSLDRPQCLSEGAD